MVIKTKSKVLVIGGSYFLGRVFVMAFHEQFNITVFNRGRFSMSEFGVNAVHGDRRDERILSSVTAGFDAIVDFCAYQPGDIKAILRGIRGTVKQYIFVSTVDVYRRGTGTLKDESTPFEMRKIAGEEGQYVAGKLALEKELVHECRNRGIAYTVFRPALIYGPFNYAPREPVFIRMMVQKGFLPRIENAKGRFQFVYVRDVAQAIAVSISNPAAFNQAYNLCNPQQVDYPLLADALAAAAGTPLEIRRMTWEQAQEQGISLPFAVREQETELYNSEKSMCELGIVYTPLNAGMEKTYHAFYQVYRDN